MTYGPPNRSLYCGLAIRMGRCGRPLDRKRKKRKKKYTYRAGQKDPTMLSLRVAQAARVGTEVPPQDGGVVGGQQGPRPRRGDADYAARAGCFVFGGRLTEERAPAGREPSK